MANNLYRWPLFISAIQKNVFFFWRIMRDHNDLPQGFQISATSRCYNEKCYNWLWKWASQSRDGLLCTWRLPAGNGREFSQFHKSKSWNLCNDSQAGLLTDPYLHNDTTCTFTGHMRTASYNYSNCLWLEHSSMVSTGIKTDKPLLVANYFKASFGQKWK